MEKTPLTTYQKKLFVFLSVATFFEGYDFIALSQLLPNLRAAMDLTEAQGGYMVAFINVGTVLAFFLVRAADRWGRKRMLTITILGYTLFSLASGLAPGPYSFAVFQLLARIFLIAEWAVSMICAAEEFPAERRGMVIGVIQGCGSLGAVACAGLVPLLISLPWGWRSVYLAGVPPLLILALARRGLRETKRFEEQVSAGKTAKRSILRIWRSPYRNRMLKLSLIWAATYVCTQNAVTFWKEFAVNERGFTDGQVSLTVAIAAVGAMPMVFYAGKLTDQIGRRWGATIIFLLAVLGVLGSYSFHSQVALTVALTFGIFGASGVLPVLNAYTTELFPTDLRGDAFAWTNNILGRIGYVISPAGVGMMAGTMGWGPAVQITVVGPILALILLWAWMPETKGRELEETARV